MSIALKNTFYFTYEFLCNLDPKRIHKREDGGEDFFFFFGRVYLEKNEKMSCHKPVGI